MARETATAILDPLRRLITRQNGSALSDAQLLEHFVNRHDEPSFEVLVWRHGAMVLAVCRRILRDAHEAEDAFQAAFLVLARNAASVRERAALGGWLHGVAYRVAARARAARNRVAESRACRSAADPGPADAMARSELRAVLDEELHRLPDKYRLPLVLCG